MHKYLILQVLSAQIFINNQLVPKHKPYYVIQSIPSQRLIDGECSRNFHSTIQPKAHPKGVSYI